MNELDFTDIVHAALRDSDQTSDGLKNCAHWFAEAHARAPGGLSIEVGTRRGGSALLFLGILDRLYDAPPMLFTVDPYGRKPYRGGDVGNDGDGPRLYGDDDYVAAKKALAPWSNHAHFLMEGLDFFAHLQGAHYWHNGAKQKISDASFVFLDGDHDSETVLTEVNLAARILAPRGVILVDNVDKDARLLPKLDGFLPPLGLVFRDKRGGGGAAQVTLVRA